MGHAVATHWLDTELCGWRPRRPLKPSEWAEQYRVLTRTQSARWGRWHNAVSPHLTTIMDLCADGKVEELVLVKSAQAGGSEAIRNVIGYYAHQEPDPLMLVLPDEGMGRKIVAHRIIPLFRQTPCLSELFTDRARDVQLRHVSLANGFTLRLAWSGSPASLAADPCRVVICDEVDKFQPFSGREADPISLAYARTQTYEGRRLVVSLSTPTTDNGLIWRRWETCGCHLRYHAPCPHCRTMQLLTFGQVRWESPKGADAAKRAAWLERERAAWYECVSCGARIEERQRASMLRSGRWVADDGQEVRGRVGVHVWAGLCIWIPLYRIAAQFVRSQGDPVLLMDFSNAWLGEPFRQQVARAERSELARKCGTGAPPARVVPDWARGLVATADTQVDHFYYVVRAWGYGYRSQRIDHGIATSFDELYGIVFGRAYARADGRVFAPRVLGIDSGGGAISDGSLTHSVYRFAGRDPARIKCLRGLGGLRKPDLPLFTKRVSYCPPGSKQVVLKTFLTLLDTEHYKDRLSALMVGRVTLTDAQGEVVGETDQWGLNSDDDDEYLRQVTSEHKISERTPGGKYREHWIPVSPGRANHYWDAEVYQIACADMVRVDLLPALERPAKTKQRPARDTGPLLSHY